MTVPHLYVIVDRLFWMLSDGLTAAIMSNVEVMMNNFFTTQGIITLWSVSIVIIVSALAIILIRYVWRNRADIQKYLKIGRGE